MPHRALPGGPLGLLALLFFVSCGGEPAPAPPGGTGAQSAPNVLFILADDLGWRDVGFQGSAYATPHIDALAARGLVLTRSYVTSPTCSPTRASLLTSHHPARIPLTRAIRTRDFREAKNPPPFDPMPGQRWLQPETLAHLPLELPSLARELQAVGYDTGFIGKWHLGLPPHVPRKYGFDHVSSLGLYSACPYVPPYNAFLQEAPRSADEYLTDRLTEDALAFLERPRERPFFLLLSHFAVHAPYRGKPELVREQQAALEGGADQGNAIYGAMIESLDDSVGRLVAVLEATGQLDNTLIVFTSDNGPKLEKDGARITTAAPFRGGKQELYEGGLRVPTVISWPDRIEPGTSDALFSCMDFFPSLVSLAGGKVPGGLDGLDASGHWLGGPAPQRERLYFHLPHGNMTAAVLDGDRKLVHHFRGGDELFDLGEDASESRDLAAERPEEVVALRSELLDWLEEVGAGVPYENPAFDPDYERPDDGDDEEDD